MRGHLIGRIWHKSARNIYIKFVCVAIPIFTEGCCELGPQTSPKNDNIEKDNSIYFVIGAILEKHALKLHKTNDLK